MKSKTLYIVLGLAVVVGYVLYNQYKKNKAAEQPSSIAPVGLTMKPPTKEEVIDLVVLTDRLKAKFSDPAIVTKLDTKPRTFNVN